MVDGVPPDDYKKPFYLYPYNRPPEEPLPPIKSIKLQHNPKIPVRWNQTTRLRNHVNRAFFQHKKKQFWEFKAKYREPGEITIRYPRIEPYHNRTSQYRYKWVREVPVVPCTFTEHIMTYKKPPFVNPVNPQKCGNFTMRKLKLDSPKKQEERDMEFMPGILM